MFSNIGKKIKTLALVICIVGIILSAIAGLALIGTGFSMFGKASYSSGFVASGFLLIFSGIAAAALGALLSWIGSFTLYGYGQMIDSVQNIEKKLCGTEPSAPESPKTFATPAKKECPECHGVNDADAKFCVVCGKAL